MKWDLKKNSEALKVRFKKPCEALKVLILCTYALLRN